MVQTLLVNSLLNRGGFRLVSRVGAGLMPDYTLMTEIQAFQAELTGADLASAQIHVAIADDADPRSPTAQSPERGASAARRR